MTRNNTSNKTLSNLGNTTADRTEWKKMAIPDSKLCSVKVDKDTKKCSFIFEIADTTACKGRFYVSASCVRRNNDRTGYIVSMPEQQMKVYDSKQVNGEWQTDIYDVQHLNELGYPFVD